MLVTPALQRWGQEGWAFKGILSYLAEFEASLGPVRAKSKWRALNQQMG